MHDIAMEAFGIAFTLGIEASLIVDLHSGAIRVANPAACLLLGYEAAELSALRIADLVRGQEPALLVFTEAVMNRRTYWTRTLMPHTAQGESLLVECCGRVLPGDSAMLLVLYDLQARRRRDTDADGETYMQDGVTAWRRTERIFQDIERENQLILQAAGEGIYGVNAEGQTTFVNSAAERILGWPAEELLGRDIHSKIHHHRADGSHYPAHECPIYAAFSDGQVYRVADEVFFRRDGKPIWVEYTSTPIRVDGAVVGAVIVFRDISQRREADEKLHAALAEVEQLRRRLEQENAYLQEEIRISGNHRGIIGRSDAIQRVAQQVDVVAPTDATVMITGESGTGKELIARAIHEASRRSHRPLIRVNCAAIPRELFESEFFGHTKGAFTGALRDRVGRFELADGGTLFLDEVGEIALDLQSKLLRVLQDGQFERVGDDRTRRVDVRVIAATNRDLLAEVERGRFRRDLYFRLNVFPIESSPLRDRQEDIPLLAAHFIQDAVSKLGTDPVTMTEGNVRALAAYSWPGNVRELQNVIERAVILARNGRIHFDLPEDRPAQALVSVEPATQVMAEPQRRLRERENILVALEACGGKISGKGGAAEMLGIPATTLQSRLKALAIDLRAIRAAARS